MNSSRLNILLIILIVLLVILALFINLNMEKAYDKQDFKSNLNTSFVLTYNQTSIIDSENLKITFIGVSEDSRCPADVVCEWPGQVSADLIIQHKQTIYPPIQLTIGPYNNSTTNYEVAGYNITLVKVEPYPLSQTKISKQDYWVTLTVNKI